MDGRLFKFFSDITYAELMIKGAIRFRTLAYFRDHEDAGIRGDADEGTSIFRPDAGLAIIGKSRPINQVWENSAFETRTKAGEIFVFCMSRRDTPRIRAAFKAVACVEIHNPIEFYRRVERALPGVALPGKPGRERIGHPVVYYRPGKPPEARWQVPDLIALSKLEDFGWQHEQRLVYSRTDALDFGNISAMLIKGESLRSIDESQHGHEDVDFGDIADIASLHLV